MLGNVSMDRARNHLIELELGVSLLAVLLVQNILTIIVLAPSMNQALELVHVAHGHDGVVNDKIENGARQATEVETGIGLDARLGFIEKRLAIVLRGGVSARGEAVAAISAPLERINTSPEIDDFEDAAIGRHSESAALEFVVQEFYSGFAK